MDDAGPPSDGPARLPGRSAARLHDLGAAPLPYAGLGTVPIAFESKFGAYEYLWGGLWLGVVVLVAGLSLSLLWRSRRKRRAEVDSGYTTFETVYLKNQDLFLFDARSLELVLTPTVEWRSLDLARQTASMRGENTYRADQTARGQARARQALVIIYRAQHSEPVVGQDQLPRPRPMRAVAARVAPMVLALAGVVVVWTFVLTSSGSKHSHPGTGNTGTQTGRVLSHIVVEQQIEVFSLVDGVVCNGGHDVDVTFVGQTFTCIAPGGRTFTVTVSNPNTGGFTWR